MIKCLEFLLIAILILCYGCKKHHSAKAEAVDSTYLTSKSFKSFQKEYKHEQQLRKKQKNAWKGYLKHHEQSFPLRGLPVTIDEKEVEHVLAKSSVYNAIKPNTYYPVGRIRLGRLTLLLFLYDEGTTYRNCTLWGATLQNGIIRDSKQLARFQKNITKHTKSRVQIVSKNRIDVYVERTIKYATKFTAEQTNDEEYHYPITQKGRILSHQTF